MSYTTTNIQRAIRTGGGIKLKGDKREGVTNRLFSSKRKRAGKTIKSYFI